MIPKIQVSIIMPAYNAEKYISASIESVMNQTYKLWELIIINDGSTDDTGEIIKSYVRQDPRIKYIEKENGGQSRARNKGITEAKYDYIAFLDADDIWLPDKLEIQVKYLSETKADLIFSQGFIVLENNFSDRKPFDTPFHTSLTGMEIFPGLIQSNFIPILSVVAKKEKLFQAGLFIEDRIAEDYHLWLAMAKDGATFLSIKERLFLYRIHSDSASANFPRLKRDEIFTVKKFHKFAGLPDRLLTKRIGHLYNHLIKYYIKNGDREAAFQTIDEFYTHNKVIAFAQKTAITINPFLYFNITQMLYKLSDYVKHL